MTASWKDLERRVCRALGAERRPSVGRNGWASGSDDDGTAPFAVEVKRTKRLQLRAAWLTQARRNAKADGRPWLIVIGTHSSPRLVAVLDFYELVRLCATTSPSDEGGRMPPFDQEAEPPTEPPPVPGDPVPDDEDE